MIAIAGLLLLGFQSQQVSPKAISQIIDTSLNGSAWTGGAWNADTGRSKIARLARSYNNGDLTLKCEVEDYGGPGFWESRPASENIPLVSKEVAYRHGKNWGVWLLDFSDSEKSIAGTQMRTNIMLKFFSKNVGGHLVVRTSDEHGYLPSDRKMTLTTFKKIFDKLESRFKAAGK